MRYRERLNPIAEEFVLTVESSKLRTSDHQTITFDLHTGTGRPLVFLHGLGQQRRFWDPVSSNLGEHTYLRIDQRCHGESDTPINSELSIARCALDAIEVIDRLNLVNPLIVGHSWGASIALSVSAQAGFDSLLIDGAITPLSTLGVWSEIRPRFEPPISSFSSSQVHDWIKSSGIEDVEAAVSAVSFGYRENEDGRLQTRIGLHRHMAVLDELAAYNPIVDYETVGRGTCTVTALLAGPMSDSREISVLDIQSVYPDLRVLVWPEAIHDVPLQFPQRIADLITELAKG